MSQAADLLRQGQTFLAAQFPATITIAGQDYACATSGLSGGADLILGGLNGKARVAFWLPATAFALAGQPDPEPRRSKVTWNSVDYMLDEIKRDGAGATVTLICLSLDQ